MAYALLSVLKADSKMCPFASLASSSGFAVPVSWGKKIKGLGNRKARKVFAKHAKKNWPHHLWNCSDAC
jgi:hypothetical protein